MALVAGHREPPKRAQFIGVNAYVEAGGTVLNDLFQGDDGGWLQDIGLVDMMVAEKLNEASVTIGAEGWKWVEVAPDFAYGHTYGLRQIRGETVPFTPEEEATLAALQHEVDDIETASAETEELTDEQDQRMGELETAIEALNARPVVFDADEVVRAGAFLSIAADGSLRIERGYVRSEDELPVEPERQHSLDTLKPRSAVLMNRLGALIHDGLRQAEQATDGEGIGRIGFHEFDDIAVRIAAIGGFAQAGNILRRAVEAHACRRQPGMFGIGGGHRDTDVRDARPGQRWLGLSEQLEKGIVGTQHHHAHRGVAQPEDRVRGRVARAPFGLEYTERASRSISAVVMLA